MDSFHRFLSQKQNKPKNIYLFIIYLTIYLLWKLVVLKPQCTSQSREKTRNTHESPPRHSTCRAQRICVLTIFPGDSIVHNS